MICPICDQEIEISGAEYCDVHQRAFENVQRAFENWTAAYGTLTLPDFLQRVQKAPGIGPRAKEVAQFLSANSPRWKH